MGTHAELPAQSQVRPATNEEAEGIETVTSLLPKLTEAVREGRTRHFADITDEGDPEDDEPTVVEGRCHGRSPGKTRFAARTGAQCTCQFQRPITHCQIRQPRGARGRSLDFSRHGYRNWSQ